MLVVASGGAFAQQPGAPLDRNATFELIGRSVEQMQRSIKQSQGAPNVYSQAPASIVPGSIFSTEVPLNALTGPNATAPAGVAIVREPGQDQHRHAAPHKHARNRGARPVLQLDIKQCDVGRVPLDPVQRLSTGGERSRDRDPGLLEVGFQAHRDKGLILSRQTERCSHRAHTAIMRAKRAAQPQGDVGHRQLVRSLRDIDDRLVPAPTLWQVASTFRTPSARMSAIDAGGISRPSLS
jgi:hypothetical protein